MLSSVLRTCTQTCTIIRKFETYIYTFLVSKLKGLGEINYGVKKLNKPGMCNSTVNHSFIHRQYNT